MTTFTANFAFPISAAGVNHPDNIQELHASANFLEDRLSRAASEIHAIKRDRMRSPEGIGLGLADVGQAVKQEIAQKYASPITDRAAVIERKTAELTSPVVRHELPALLDRGDARQSEWEARSFLRTLDPLEVEGLYLKACAEDDRQTVRSVELAPHVSRLVSLDVLEKGAALHAQALFPTRWRDVQESKEVLDLLRFHVAHAIGQIDGMLTVQSLPWADPIPAAAAAD